ncbi:MAG: hypothetical protein DWQ31_16050 [Planctomycetota bacterium]|nr:MAG: hypothetical protein DWQ31_16050 [Planctomycetota bacterium]
MSMRLCSESFQRRVVAALSLGFFLGTALVVLADEPGCVVFEEDFENGADKWTPTDPSAWKIKKTEDGNVYSLFKDSEYSPPHTSPLNIAWLDDVELGDFEATLRVRSNTHDYGHRDLCFFLGYQDPARFYYCHLANRGDDRANQIFIVNNAARVKISEKTTEGTPWNDKWHTVKIVRKLGDGLIEVYFDNMEEPIMVAHDTTHGRGKFGIGSFDDAGDFDDIRIVRLEESTAAVEPVRRWRRLRLFGRRRNR